MWGLYLRPLVPITEPGFPLWSPIDHPPEALCSLAFLAPGFPFFPSPVFPAFPSPSPPLRSSLCQPSCPIGVSSHRLAEAWAEILECLCPSQVGLCLPAHPDTLCPKLNGHKAWATLFQFPRHHQGGQYSMEDQSANFRARWPGLHYSTSCATLGNSLTSLCPNILTCDTVLTNVPLRGSLPGGWGWLCYRILSAYLETLLSTPWSPSYAWMPLAPVHLLSEFHQLSINCGKALTPSPIFSSLFSIIQSFPYPWSDSSSSIFFPRTFSGPSNWPAELSLSEATLPWWSGLLRERTISPFILPKWKWISYME